MEGPHVHADLAFQDLEIDDPALATYHLAFKALPVDWTPPDNLAPYIPLSISFGPGKAQAQRWTLHYGMQRDFRSGKKPSDQDYEAVLALALARLGQDIGRFEGGDHSVLAERLLVRP